MTKMKKTLLTLGVAAAAGTTAAIAISCSNAIQDSKNYDLGLTTAPVNSLNYVLYKNTFIVTPALVEGIIKDGPDDKTKNLLTMPSVRMSLTYNNNADKDMDKYTTAAQSSGQYYPWDNYGLTTGVGAATNNTSYTTESLIDNNLNLYSMKARLNEGQSTWKMASKDAAGYGDSVSPQDFIDHIQYILDLNTGSQYLVDLLNFNIKNSQAVVDAQNAYIRKHSTSYIDPFGRKDANGNELSIYEPGVWESQIEGDEDEVKAIKDAVEGLGVYTGDWGTYDSQAVSELSGARLTSFLKTSNNRYVDPRQTWQVVDGEIVGNSYLYAENKWDIRFEFEDTNPPSFSTFASALSGAVIKPINRKFVESLGGIREFGVLLEKFAWNGPFDPIQIELGAQGFIFLKKRENYYSASKTLMNTIKIFFQTEETVNAAMFQDGLISQTNIPTEYIQKFWSDTTTRALMRKKTGFGTVALQLNLDTETQGGDDPENNVKYQALMNSDFRSALYYAINRADVLALVGLDTSFPVVTWTAFGQAKTAAGVNLELFFDNVYAEAKDASYIQASSSVRYAKTTDTSGKETYTESTSGSYIKVGEDYHQVWDGLFKKVSDDDFVKITTETTGVTADNTYYKLNGTKFAIQSFLYQDHLAKNFTFENVDRTDNNYNVKVAQYYLSLYKKAHPDVDGITLTYLYDSTPMTTKAGIAIQDLFKQAFDGFVTVELKGYTPSIFEQFRSRGNFDLAYSNFDNYGTEYDSYISKFFFTDEINTAQQKTSGFRTNPSGSWTYATYFDDLAKQTLESNGDEMTRIRLGISKLHWNKLKELSVADSNASYLWDAQKTIYTTWSNYTSQAKQLSAFNDMTTLEQVRLFALMSDAEKYNILNSISASHRATLFSLWSDADEFFTFASLDTQSRQVFWTLLSNETVTWSDLSDSEKASVFSFLSTSQLNWLNGMWDNEELFNNYISADEDNKYIIKTAFAPDTTLEWSNVSETLKTQLFNFLSEDQMSWLNGTWSNEQIYNLFMSLNNTNRAVLASLMATDTTLTWSSVSSTEKSALFSFLTDKQNDASIVQLSDDNKNLLIRLLSNTAKEATFTALSETNKTTLLALVSENERLIRSMTDTQKAYLVAILSNSSKTATYNDLTSAVKTTLLDALSDSEKTIRSMSDQEKGWLFALIKNTSEDTLFSAATSDNHNVFNIFKNATGSARVQLIGSLGIEQSTTTLSNAQLNELLTFMDATERTTFINSLTETEKSWLPGLINYNWQYWILQRITGATYQWSETDAEWKTRVNKFLSSNYTTAETADGWTQEENFRWAASLEKIIKDAAPVIPLVEIDTNWEISRLGGMRSTYTFSLQYVYDYNEPPLPGLPTSPST